MKEKEATLYQPVYNVVVDYNLSLVEMIEAGGYDRVNDDITIGKFPVQGEGKQKLGIALVHFNRFIESDEVIKEMDKAGYRPASLPELLSLGVSLPELQRQFPIIALRFVWQNRIGFLHVPYELVWRRLASVLSFCRCPQVMALNFLDNWFCLSPLPLGKIKIKPLCKILCRGFKIPRL